MMKLKYLFDNRDLAHMILEIWNYDHSHPEVLNQYRISANAVYPFISGGNVCFLRFSPYEEKCPDDIRAELDLLSFLKSSGYPAVETVLSKNGRDLEIIETPWGTYSAVVFKAVPGKRLDQMQLTEEIIYRLGQSLGQLHCISSRYAPVGHKRLDWRQQLDWIRVVLQEYPEEVKAREEEALLRSRLSQLPVNVDTFGLIHYDFEMDNLFYDERDGSVHPIDFDDAVYHWYVMDIEQAAESLTEDLPESFHADAVQSFLDGYRSEKTTDDTLLKEMPVFRRYASLYSYTRILRATSDHLQIEPDWMMNLREYLACFMNEKKLLFGTDFFDSLFMSI